MNKYETEFSAAEQRRNTLFLARHGVNTSRTPVVCKITSEDGGDAFCIFYTFDKKNQIHLGFATDMENPSELVGEAMLHFPDAKTLRMRLDQFKDAEEKMNIGMAIHACPPTPDITDFTTLLDMLAAQYGHEFDTDDSLSQCWSLIHLEMTGIAVDWPAYGRDPAKYQPRDVDPEKLQNPATREGSDQLKIIPAEFYHQVKWILAPLPPADTKFRVLKNTSTDVKKILTGNPDYDLETKDIQHIELNFKRNGQTFDLTIDVDRVKPSKKRREIAPDFSDVREAAAEDVWTVKSKRFSFALVKDARMFEYLGLKEGDIVMEKYPSVYKLVAALQSKPTSKLGEFDFDYPLKIAMQSLPNGVNHLHSLTTKGGFLVYRQGKRASAEKKKKKKPKKPKKPPLFAARTIEFNPNNLGFGVDLENALDKLGFDLSLNTNKVTFTMETKGDSVVMTFQEVADSQLVLVPVGDCFMGAKFKEGDVKFCRNVKGYKGNLVVPGYGGMRDLIMSDDVSTKALRVFFEYLIGGLQGKKTKLTSYANQGILLIHPWGI